MFVSGLLLTRAQDVQGDIFVEASVDNAAPYIGQQIIYTFKLYDAVGTTNPLYAPSDFDGFWRVDIGVVSQTNEQINGRAYTVTTIATALYPTQAGEVSIQPASVVLPETVFRSEARLSASALPIIVQPLPKGQPAGFSGAVGSFEMTASLDRQSVPAGQPVTMQLTLTGTGNIEQLPLPNAPSDWRTSIAAGEYSSEIRNGIVIGKRAYTILFYPSISGKQFLPSISMSYFDPAASIYRSVSTPPVEIDVIGTIAGADNQDVIIPENRLKLKPIQLASSSNTGLNLGLFLVLMLLPVAGISGFAGWRWFQERQEELSAQSKKAKALQNALKQIDIIKGADVQSTYEQIELVIQTYVADKLGVKVVSLENRDLLSVMAANNLSRNTISIMRELIERVNEGLFGPASQFLPSHIQGIEKLLTTLDQHWVQN